MTSKRKRLVVIGGVVAALLVGGAVWWRWPAPKPDIMKGRGFHCWKVGKCSEQCALRCPGGLKKFQCMMDCKNRCTARGCPTARPVHERLTDCVQKKCLWKCMGGPCPECDQCTKDKCPKHREACRKHRCKS